jgi:hypothetical protein
MKPSSPLVRCGGCGEPPGDGRALRRGRCDRCYDAWVRARPVGVGASCAGCDDRRHAHLRHYEIFLRQNVPGGRWVILCHNCCAVADKLKPPPRSIEQLRMRIARDRRFGERRVDPRGRPDGIDRRVVDRRFPVEEAAEHVIELEAEWEPLREISEDQLADIDEITGIHFKIPE